MMIVVVADTEQHTYLPHDANTSSRLPICKLASHHAQWEAQESQYCRRPRLLQ